MKRIYLIFILSIICQPLLFSQVVVKRNNQVSKEAANVNWSKEFTLFDYTTDEPIFPLIRNGQAVYKIYYASKEDPRPNYGEFSIAQVEGLKYYKFKNRETCFKFCLANKLNAVPKLTTTSIASITNTSATSGGIITSDGGASITSRGIVWSTTTNPTITLNTKTSNGTGTGSFSSSLTNLTPKTTYYVRAYATNSAGTDYGNEITFTTTDSSNVMGIPCPGTPTVKDIDGNTYNTVQIGTQCWTKENLRVTKYRDGSVIPLDESGGTAGNGTGQTWSSRTTGARTVYAHSATNLATYGYLYNWYAAVDTKGICPSGWHVPSDGEWTTLIDYLDGEGVAGGKIKTPGTTNWKNPNKDATNVSGFSAIPAGGRGSIFANLSENSQWWSNTEDSDVSSWFYLAHYSSDDMGYAGGPNFWGMSIRCILGLTSNVEVSVPVVKTSDLKDITSNNAKSGVTIISNGGGLIRSYGIVYDLNPNPTIALSTRTTDGPGTGSFSSSLINLTPKTTYFVRAYATNSAGAGYGNEITFTTTDSSNMMGIPCPGTPTIKDIDGNTYNTVQIGSQCWTKENLRVTKYRDGTAIPLDDSGGTTGNGTGQTWSSRTTGAKTVYGHSATNLVTYGYLYNWYAVADTKGLCPSGWHLPLDGEWTILTSYLGGESVAGGKMKSTGTTYWVSPNTGATNESGFSALPGGCRNSDDGSFNAVRGNAYFWSAAEGDFFSAWFRNLNFNLGYVTRSDDSIKSFGASVRCLKDTFSIVSIPTLTTTTITAITSNSAISGGNITADGGTTITARGVVWSISTNPTIALTTKTTDGSGTGSFTSLLTNLAPKITYYVRAYATNSAGTGYGNEISFTTSDSSNVMGIPCPGTPTVKDIDGNTYNTVQIGTQCWTKENLRVTKYRDGSVIPLDESGGTNGGGTGQTWSSRTTGARTVNGHSAANLATYGYLYNWHAVADTKGLCPNGWNVPSEADWKSLGEYLGTNAGVKLADTSWLLATGKPTNESGFSVIPGGIRDTTGRFGSPLISGNFWSTSYSNNFTVNPCIGTELYSKGDWNWNLWNYNTKSGLSVRCLKLPDSIVSLPIVSTTQVTSISANSVVSGGTIYSDRGSSVTSRGVVWAINPAPTIALSTKTTDYLGTGTFSSSIINLKPNTTYYLRAYATNKIGTTYGNELIFNTQDTLMNIPCPGYSTVKDIDGNIYNTVKIGSQCWTKENLRVTKYRDGTAIPLDDSGGTTGNGIGQTWNSRITGARTIYEHNAGNLATYGYLYNWYAAADTKGLCPSGWNVPNDNDFSNLTAFLGGVQIAGALMKTIGTTFWKIPNSPATNESGFSALPGGHRNNVFTNIGFSVGFWSTTNDIYDYSARVIGLNSNGASLLSFGTSKSTGFSIRCLKDTFSIVSIPTLTTTAITAITATSATSGGVITSDGGAAITVRGVVWSTTTNPTINLTTKTSNGNGTGSFSSSLTNLIPKTIYYVRAYANNSAGTGYGNEITFTTTDSSTVMGIPCPGTPTVKDIDGNTYNTVQIGTQCWTKENLRVTKYRDGSVIPLDESGGTTGVGTGQTWGNRNTGARTVYEHSSSNLATYGYLYNWYAVADSKGLCPSGWHVPSDSEWTTLTTSLGGESVAGGKMKSIGTIYWFSPNNGATNESGFSALPGGYRFSDGSFFNIRNIAFFLSATEYDNSNAWNRPLDSSSGGVYRGFSNKSVGASVRCLRD